MIVTGSNFDSASANPLLPLAVGPAISATFGSEEDSDVFIATLIAAERLSAGDISVAQDALGAGVLSSHWIEHGRACDIRFTGEMNAARFALEGLIDGVDVIVQVEAERRRKLIVADMDSTMITIECIDELADYAGIKPQIAEVTERAMRGELDFEDALRSRVALLKGLPETVIEQCLRERVTIMPGAKELIRTMRANGGQAVLVSGGFTRFAEPVGHEIGFHQAIANQLGIANGALDGTVVGNIVGAQTKRDTLLASLAERSWSASDALAVGDGANDIPMIEAAGLGVAYHAKPKTAAAAGACIQFNDLTAILYAMGYPRAAWVMD
jgi:phosphoserine phosphatase